MSAWNLVILAGVSAIWVALAAAVYYLAAAVAPAAERSRAAMRARGVEPPRAFRPSGT